LCNFKASFSSPILANNLAFYDNKMQLFGNRF